MFSQLEIYDRALRRGNSRMPVKQPIDNLLDLIQLTEENRKQYIKLGNTVWAVKIDHRKKYYDIVNAFPIIPCLREGWWYYKNFPLHRGILVVRVLEDNNKGDWVRGFREVIRYGIELGNTYFDPACPKTEWKHSKVRLTK